MILIDWKSFFLTVVVGLVVAAITFFLGFLIRQILTSERKKEFLHWALLTIAGVSGFIAICEIIQAYRRDVLPVIQFLLILFSLLIHWGTGSVAYFATRLQYGRKFKVRGTSASIYVRNLYSCPSGKNLLLSWETVSRGVKSLIEQIKQQRGGGANFCIGINNAGGAYASFLAGSIGGLDPLPVFIAIAKGAHRNLDRFRQSLPEETDPIILVVDMQLRTGASMKKVVDILREKYGPKTRILKAVLAVVSIKGSIKNIEEIKKGISGAFEQESEYLPDYVAFIHDNSSIRLPENIQ
jgi:hypoxanthine-guanine phosphoribosyltransferase